MEPRRTSCPSRRDFIKLVAAGSLGLALGGNKGFAEEAPGLKKPHILLLMTDQHRADCIGCAGNSHIKTPNLDRIAREGVRFAHAYSSTPTCTPARAGLLTGQSPWHHGMLAYGELAERYPIEMPRLLRDAGYYAYAVGKLHYHPQRNYHGFNDAQIDESGRVLSPGFISDYRKWFKGKAPELNPDATGIDWNGYASAVYALPEELHPTHWTGDTAVEFIQKYNREEPMFLKVSFARPHSPYDPPKRFMEMYQESDMPAPHVGDWARKFAKHSEGGECLWYGDLGVEQAKRSRRGYYGSVSFIDEQIGKVLEALNERNMLDDTLIIFTADHGDMLGDHHHWRKSYAYESSAHIPMLLRWPNSFGLNGERGTALDQPVELRDVLPTFLDVAGKAVPDKVDGKSLLNLVRGRAQDWRSYIDLEHGRCYEPHNQWNALTDGDWKYIYFAPDGAEQLFHLKEDPHELHDLANDPSHQKELKMWRERLVKHFAERGEGWVTSGKLTKREKLQAYSPNYPGKSQTES